MDRIIKFRGKNKDIGWVYGQLAYDINGNAYIIQEVEIDASYGLEESILFATMWYRVDKETIGQFTGLYDKNGKEIYEGDVLQIDVDRAYVKWNDKYGYFQLIPIEDYYFDSDVIGQALEYLEAKIIGNIYDNKNLIEEE